MRRYYACRSIARRRRGRIDIYGKKGLMNGLLMMTYSHYFLFKLRLIESIDRILLHMLASPAAGKCAITLRFSGYGKLDTMMLMRRPLL